MVKFLIIAAAVIASVLPTQAQEASRNTRVIVTYDIINGLNRRIKVFDSGKACRQVPCPMTLQEQRDRAAAIELARFKY